jgi:uncharacterized coiled-coil protein SlyX
MQDRKDLKIQALVDKLGRTVAGYENTIADLRVELTVVYQELDELKKEKEAANAPSPEEPVPATNEED